MRNGQKSIQHVVLLMLENQSFDRLLGDYKSINAQCEGINRAAPWTNSFQGRTYRQEADSFESDLTLRYQCDPWHEFSNIDTQLGGWRHPTMTGFIEDFVQNLTAKLPKIQYPLDVAQAVMNYFPFGDRSENDALPVLHGLARRYCVCDHWFSSLPAATWPNRFFALSGTARGRVLMASSWRDMGLVLGQWWTMNQAPSLFSLAQRQGVSTKLYCDDSLPMSILVKNDPHSVPMSEFIADCASDRLPQISVLEPHYGVNSEHPPEDIRAGEVLIADVYAALSNNETLFQKTLLLIYWDEHGGYFDHVPPPGAIAPDAYKADVDFDFTRLGLRVPAVIISPWIKAGLLQEVFDHTSALAFVVDHFGLGRELLGERVKQTRHFGSSDIWLEEPDLRNDLVLKPPILPKKRNLPSSSVLHEEMLLLLRATQSYLHADTPLAISADEAKPLLDQQLSHVSEESLKALPSLLSGGLEDVVPTSVSSASVRIEANLPYKSSQNQPAPRKIKVLFVHGVGGLEDDRDVTGQSKWMKDWQKVITQQWVTDKNIAWEFDAFEYDASFVDGASALQLMRVSSAFLLHTITRRRGMIELFHGIQWTLGMAVKWVDDAGLRDKLCKMLLLKIEQFQPQLIVAHSMGGLVSYDCLRRYVAGSIIVSDELNQTLNQIKLLTFGTQIYHEFIMREVWGGVVAPLVQAGYNDASTTSHPRGITRWCYLFNPNDRVLTHSMRKPWVAHQYELVTEFDFDEAGFDLHHDALAYLGHRVCIEHIASLIELTPTPLAQKTVLNHAQKVLNKQHAKRRALLVGINAYPKAAMCLEGCVNDVYDMSQWLQESGYRADAIRVLLNERATAQGIIERIAWLVENAGDGDECFIYFSGHGAKLPAYTADEADHMDETIVAYDFDWDKPATHLTDEMFANFYSQLPFDNKGSGARLVAVFDCCYAAGMTRGGSAIRGINPPLDIQHRALEWSATSNDFKQRAYVQQRYERIFSENGGNNIGQLKQHGVAANLRHRNTTLKAKQCATYGHFGPYLPTILYAAAENQYAEEIKHGAESRGAFTYQLLRYLRFQKNACKHGASHQTPQSLLTLMEQVGGEIKKSGLSQTPQLVAPRMLRESGYDLACFGAQ